VFVATLMVCCFTDITVNADDGDFTIVDGVLTAYTGSDTDVVVPDGVTTIGDGSNSVFTGTYNSITLPEGTVTIEGRAFGATGINELYIPSTLTRVKEDAFRGMSGNGIAQVYYNGSSYMWRAINIYYDEDDDVDGNNALLSAPVNYLVQRNPDDDVIEVCFRRGNSIIGRFSVLKGYSLNQDPVLVNQSCNSEDTF